ncbi:hypothetical protein B566_EDAN007755 [Ephemera danica]|nr:hypothetical protein B566_EDAN007755 [Ephemera danica]
MEHEDLKTGVPPYLDTFLLGVKVPADPNNRKDFAAPDWLDMDKFKLGQRFAMKNFTSLCFAEMVSLFMIFSFKSGLDPLIYTGKSSSPVTAFKRYASTLYRLRSWYTTDVFDDKSVGGRNISTVRLLHRNIRDRMNSTEKTQLESKIRIDNPCCPLLNLVQNDARQTIPATNLCQYESLPGRLYVSQFEMAGTQFAFIGLAILHPDKFGITGTEKELEGFLHMWAALGYLLGTEDRFNFCLGGLEICRQRTSDFINCLVKPRFKSLEPEWEHMSRSMAEGVRHSSPTPFLGNFESFFMYLCWVLEIPLPSFTKAAPWYSMPIFAIFRFFLCVLMFWLPGYRTLMNWSINRRLNHTIKPTTTLLQNIQRESDNYLQKYSINNVCPISI